MPLTNIQVKNFKAEAKDKKHFDSHGLFILVKTTGSKYWRFKYRFANKEKLLSFGVYPEVSLSEARDKRDEARKQLRDNIDPGVTKQQKKWDAKAEAENSFESLASEWWENQKGLWTEEHAARVWSSLEKDIFPSIGHRPITEIKTPELLETLRDGAESRDALDLASRLLQRCTQIFRYAVQTGRADYNPAAELSGTLKTRKVQHQPSLSHSELPDFLRSLSIYQGYPLTKLALRFLTLTFVRPGELRFARWDEFDIENKLWRIPAKRMKMKTDHLVPLSDQALAMLEEIRFISGTYPLLFPSRNNRNNPMSENTLNKAIHVMGYKGKATAHGFRATASSALNENEFNRDAIERQLAHQERNKVRAAYTYHAEYLTDRRKMMQWWANHLDSLEKGSQ